MKNTIVSLIIFTSLLGFVFYANNTLLNLCDTITSSTEEISNLITNDDWDNAHDSALELIELIKDKEIIISVYVNHNDYDNLTDEALQLSIYTGERNNLESLISVKTLENSANNIKQLHKTSIENIF